MAQITTTQRLLKEDFDQKDQALIDKLAFILNPFMDQVSNAFTSNIGISNITRSFVTVPVQNTKGVLNSTVQFKSGIVAAPVGISVIKAQNTTSPTTYPTSGVFVSWTINNNNPNMVTITNVTGIPDGNAFTLTLEIIS